MKRESCITFPPREPILIIRASYIQLCGGDTCCAALLSVFQYWHEIKLSAADQAREHNAAAVAAGQAADQDEGCWVYKSADELVDDLLGMYKDKSVRAALKKLQELGFIQQRRNPRFQFDNKPQWLFIVSKVQEGVAKTAKSTRQNYRSAKQRDQSVKMPRRLGKNTATIPETTISEIPSNTEITSESLAPVGAPLPDDGEQPFHSGEQKPFTPSSAAPLLAFMTERGAHITAGKTVNHLTCDDARTLCGHETLAEEVIPDLALCGHCRTELMDGGILDALSVLCFGTVAARKMSTNASALRKALNDVRQIEPDVTTARVTLFQKEWFKTDFRGQRKQRPIPHQVSLAWPTLMIAPAKSSAIDYGPATPVDAFGKRPNGGQK